VEDEITRTEREIAELQNPLGGLLAALETARQFRPRPREPRLLHGDPLLQNLVLQLDGRSLEESYVWIDWEFARLGDPVYDISIFTRGQLGNLYGLRGGRTLYQKAYETEARISIDERDLLFYELLLVVRGTCSLIMEGRRTLAEEELRRLAKLEARAKTLPR
jgi:aminoglycoside phosphotransferase (APT) family kinase protein